MKKFLLVFACLASLFSVFSQEKESVYDKISREEAVKIVKSRKIHKSKDDPQEKIPIKLPERNKQAEEEEELEKIAEDHPSLKGFLDTLEDHGLDNVASLSIDYTLRNLDNHGFGIDLKLEKKLLKFLSVRGNVSLQTQVDSSSDTNCLGWNGGLNVCGYPFCKGLEWLYGGVGLEVDYFSYDASNNMVNEKNDLVLSIVPSIGWKQFFFRNIMIDVTLGYKCVVANTNNFDSNMNYVNSGFQVSIGYSIMWNRALRHFITDYILINPEK